MLTHIHGGILDHFFTPDSLLVDKVIINDCLSDHMVIKVSLPIQMDSINLDNFISVRQFHKIDKPSLQQDLVDFNRLQIRIHHPVKIDTISMSVPAKAY